MGNWMSRNSAIEIACKLLHKYGEVKPAVSSVRSAGALMPVHYEFAYTGCGLSLRVK